MNLPENLAPANSVDRPAVAPELDDAAPYREVPERRD